MVTVVNTTCTFTLGCRLELLKLARSMWNVEYHPKSFNALKFRLRNPRCTSLIYSSGSVVILGCKSKVEGKLARRKIIARVQRLGYLSEPTELKLANMVGTIKLDLSHDQLIEKLQASSYRWSYDPELMPAVMIYFGKVTATFTRNGTVSLTGAKCEEDLESAWIELLLL